MFPVLTLAHNCIQSTMRCVQSVHLQDIPGVELFVIDNDSTDGTREWLIANHIPHARFRPQLGVSAGWNFGLDWFFRQPEVEHVLVIGNDTWLPSNFYRELMGYQCPFVTGVTESEAKVVEKTVVPEVLGECPDFSAFLMRRDCWTVVGRFDEDMKLYASDCDYHVRAKRFDIPLFKANVPFGHDRSSTIRNAKGAEAEALAKQAEADRQTFAKKWGCLPGTPEYAALFTGKRPTLVQR